MPIYEIYFRKVDGTLALKYAIPCADDIHAKVLAHALMSREYKRIEVWQNQELVYERPATFGKRATGQESTSLE